MFLKKAIVIVLTVLSVAPSFAADATEKPAAIGAAEPDVAKPLSIRDLEKAFGGAGLPDAEVIRSIGAATPLSPDQIRAIRQRVEEIRRASSEPPYPTPKPSVSSRRVSLEPGTQPSLVRLHNGIVSSIVFQDLTGAPWPVASILTGNQDWTTSHAAGGNIVMISPKIEYSESNMSVLLEGAPAPIILSLKAGRNTEVDHRLDLVVQARGPRASSISMDVGAISNIPDYLIAFQDGVPPADAKPVLVRGVDGVRVWRFNNRLVARTQMTLTAPESPKAIRSADGTYVYEIDETPVAYFTFGGKRFRADIDI